MNIIYSHPINIPIPMAFYMHLLLRGPPQNLETELLKAAENSLKTVPNLGLPK